MVFLVSFDAIGRYFFNSPITGGFELTERYLLPLIIFLSISMTWKLDGHIRINILFDKFPLKLQKYLNIIALITGIIFLFLIAYEGYFSTYDAWEKQLQNTGIINLPKYLQLVWVPIGAGMACLHLIFDLFKLIFKSRES